MVDGFKFKTMDEASTSGPKNNMMTIVAVVVAVTLLILAGGVFAFKDQLKELLMPESAQTESSVTPESTTLTEETLEVEYTTDGFLPKSVTVKNGETVKFVNQSGSPMSVASDPHPTHTILPELDQYKSDARGKDEYEFTFTKVGSWGYHNHMNATDKGTVVVTP